MRRVLVAAIAFVVALSCAAAALPSSSSRAGDGATGWASRDARRLRVRARDGGRNYRWILDHYYTGTTLGTSGVGRVRVLLAAGAGSLSIGSPAAFTVKTQRQVVQPEARVLMSSGRTCASRPRAGVLARSPAPSVSDRGRGSRQALGQPLSRGLLRPFAGQAALRRQRHRPRAVRQGRHRLEMPADWHPEALKAQAVVARTYGLVSRKSGWFDLFGDTRSQVCRRPRRRFAHERSPSTPLAARSSARGERLRGRSTTRPRAERRRLARTSGARPGIPCLVGVSIRTTTSPHHRWGPLVPRTTVPTVAGTACGRRPPSSARWGAGRPARSGISRLRPQRLQQGRADPAHRALRGDLDQRRRSPQPAGTALDLVHDRRPATERRRLDREGGEQRGSGRWRGTSAT